jgi:hypothetical protein
MAHFYVSTDNSRGTQTTAAGTQKGQTTWCRGWSSGVKVVASVGSDGLDRFDIYGTDGSNGSGSSFHIGHVDNNGVFHDGYGKWRSA